MHPSFHLLHVVGNAEVGELQVDEFLRVRKAVLRVLQRRQKRKDLDFRENEDEVNVKEEEVGIAGVGVDHRECNALGKLQEDQHEGAERRIGMVESGFVASDSGEEGKGRVDIE